MPAESYPKIAQLKTVEAFRRRLDEFLFNEFTLYSKAYLRGAVKRELCQVN